MKKYKHILPLFVILFIWGGIAVFSWLKPADSFSLSERRKLTDFPKPTFESVISGNYIGKFESYTLDQFPLRDRFRTLKSVSEFYLFQKSDNNKIYISDGHAAKMEYPLNQKSIQNAVNKLNGYYETYVKNHSTNVYLSIVPDKSYFMAEQTNHLALDYETLFDTVKNEMPYAKYIDVAQTLNLDDYYKTDPHWKQENITDVANLLADSMGISISENYEETIVEKPFYGAYYGQSALPLENDTIHYLSNDVLDNCIVYNMETQENTGLYNLNKLESRDMYEVYLSGASPLLCIENPNAASEKELVVFRDSFASSLVPLLAEGYAKVTLIDTRYMQPSMITESVDFTEADVLFLYSTTVLNNSQTLR